MKKRIKLTESDMNRIVGNCVNEILQEAGFKDRMAGMWNGFKQGNQQMRGNQAMANANHMNRQAMANNSNAANSMMQELHKVYSLLSAFNPSDQQSVNNVKQAYQIIGGILKNGQYQSMTNRGAF